MRAPSISTPIPTKGLVVLHSSVLHRTTDQHVKGSSFKSNEFDMRALSISTPIPTKGLVVLHPLGDGHQACVRPQQRDGPHVQRERGELLYHCSQQEGFQKGYAGAQYGTHKLKGVCRSTVWDALFKRVCMSTEWNAWLKRGTQEHRVECIIQTGYAGAQCGMHGSNGVCRSTEWIA